MLGQRGMNQGPISDSDPRTVSLLNKLHVQDPSVDVDLDGEDADGIRSLQLLCRRAPTVSTVVAAATAAPAAGSAEEEAGSATLAVAFYACLEQTQGVRVKHDMHLDYALMAQNDVQSAEEEWHNQSPHRPNQHCGEEQEDR